ncbi:hypothetical protein AAE02nite_13070 [Adhaeribacter aerolatus]|uniref:Uncharacterized protein n=1 Tax=Adhaeribacter aerolatus TaxID=670289 RepID=A0A512AVC7_9BACT|nr:hypothetical protein [Adhaeribacter aerolatus]GEO03643.1 hypothetical protein AAE02nite_13070 [Adhaeribacter aerolatus]
MLRNLLLGLSVIFCFARCSEEVTTTDAEIGREYYPIKIGNYWIYDVVETRVSNNKYDSTKYQVRERVDTVFRNAADELTYQLVLSRKNRADANWGNDSLVLVNKSLSDVLRTHNNFKTIKLLFPVQEGKQWDTNAFNILDADDFSYARVNQPFVLHNITYDSTVTVVQGEPNEVMLDDRTEVYAYNIGLIYKNFTVYEYVQTQGVSDKNKVARGLRRVFKLNTFHAAE